MPDDGGDPITSHDYRYREQGVGAPWIPVTGVTSTTQVVFGLDRSTQYEFQSRATNLVDDSQWSTSGSGTTLAGVEVTITIPDSRFFSSTNNIRWVMTSGNLVDVGRGLSLEGVNQFIGLLRIATNGSVRLRFSASQTENLTDAGPDFNDQMESIGTIVMRLSNGHEIVLTGIGDSDDPYQWTPSNSADLGEFRTQVEGLVNQSLTLVFNDNPPVAVAPSFADDTGDAQTWTENVAIAPVTVPAADGTPIPTYAAVGTLPAGISFNTTTRVISGTPSAIGSGTITIRASNSEGMADWTVDYNTAAPLAAPSFADDTGDTQAWIENQAVASITVPEARRQPAPDLRCSRALCLLASRSTLRRASFPVHLRLLVLAQSRSGRPTAKVWPTGPSTTTQGHPS